MFKVTSTWFQHASVFLHYLQLSTRRRSAVINYRLSGCYSHYPWHFEIPEKKLKIRQRYGTNHALSPAINTKHTNLTSVIDMFIQYTLDREGQRLSILATSIRARMEEVASNLPLIISWGLSQTWTILINLDSMWIQLNGSRNSKNTSRFLTWRWPSSLRWKRITGRTGRKVGLYGQDQVRKIKTKMLPFY